MLFYSCWFLQGESQKFLANMKKVSLFKINRDHKIASHSPKKCGRKTNFQPSKWRPISGQTFTFARD